MLKNYCDALFAFASMIPTTEIENNHAYAKINRVNTKADKSYIFK